MPESPRHPLLRVPPDKYGDHYAHHLLEQYKLYVEMADRISARRQTANDFFLTVNTALVALLGYLRTVQENSGVGQLYWLVAAAGIVLAYLWYRTVRSYQNLNSAKFEVIHEMEHALPLRPYSFTRMFAAR